MQGKHWSVSDHQWLGHVLLCEDAPPHSTLAECTTRTANDLNNAFRSKGPVCSMRLYNRQSFQGVLAPPTERRTSQNVSDHIKRVFEREAADEAKVLLVAKQCAEAAVEVSSPLLLPLASPVEPPLLPLQQPPVPPAGDADVEEEEEEEEDDEQEVRVGAIRSARSRLRSCERFLQLQEGVPSYTEATCIADNLFPEAARCFECLLVLNSSQKVFRCRRCCSRGVLFCERCDENVHGRQCATDLLMTLPFSGSLLDHAREEWVSAVEPQDPGVVRLPLGGLWRFRLPERRMMFPRQLCACGRDTYFFVKEKEVTLITEDCCFNVLEYSMACVSPMSSFPVGEFALPSGVSGECGVPLQCKVQRVNWLEEGFQCTVLSDNGKTYIHRSIVEEWASSYFADPRYGPEHKIVALRSKLKLRGVPEEYLPGSSLTAEAVRNAIQLVSAVRLKKKEAGSFDGFSKPHQRTNGCPSCVRMVPVPFVMDLVCDSALADRSEPVPVQGSARILGCPSSCGPQQYDLWFREGFQMLGDGNFKAQLRGYAAADLPSVFGDMMFVQLPDDLERRRQANSTKSVKPCRGECDHAHKAGSDGAPSASRSGEKMALSGIFLCLCKHGFAFYAEDIVRGEKVCVTTSNL